MMHSILNSSYPNSLKRFGTRKLLIRAGVYRNTIRIGEKKFSIIQNLRTLNLEILPMSWVAMMSSSCLLRTKKWLANLTALLANAIAINPVKKEIDRQNKSGIRNIFLPCTLEIWFKTFQNLNMPASSLKSKLFYAYPSMK